MNYIEYMGMMPGDKLAPTKFYKTSIYYEKNPDGSDMVATFVSRDSNNSTIKVTIDGALHSFSIDHWKPLKQRNRFMMKARAVFNVIRDKSKYIDYGELRW